MTDHDISEAARRSREGDALAKVALAFDVDDAVTGDAVCAVVVTDPASAVTHEDLAAWCRSSLARYKVPTHWHVVHERLPRTASGKLVKHEVRRLVETGGA
jgi:long-chain acyl-CoA synthetase